MFRWSRRSTLLAAILATWGSALPLVREARALSRTVPSPFTTIQAAIDASAAGDTVLVAPGTYTNTGNVHLHFTGPEIVLLSSGGPEVTIVDCENFGRGISFVNGETSAAVVSGFTFMRGSGSGGGINILTSSPTIDNCRFLDNHGSTGGGVQVIRGAPTFTNCVISNNSADGTGGGLFLSSSAATLTGCTISGNSASSGGGVGVGSDASAPSFTECVLSGNSASSSGGGLYAFTAAPHLSACTIAGNRAGTSGGGIGITNTGNAILQACVLWGNCAPLGSGANVDAQSQITFSCSDFNLKEVNGPVSPAPGNFAMDPHFCAPVSCTMAPTTAGDYHVSTSSPLIQPMDCGTIGALGATCADEPVEAATWSGIKARHW